MQRKKECLFYVCIFNIHVKKTKYMGPGRKKCTIHNYKVINYLTFYHDYRYIINAVITPVRNLLLHSNVQLFHAKCCILLAWMDLLMDNKVLLYFLFNFSFCDQTLKIFFNNGLTNYVLLTK